jgi:hypothetical protein
MGTYWNATGNEFDFRKTQIITKYWLLVHN